MISYVFFELYYGYYLNILYRQDINSRSKLKTTNMLIINL